MNEDQTKAVVDALIANDCKLSAYNDLLAMLLAELAALDGDPVKRLESLHDSERNAVYSAVSTDESEALNLDRIRLAKATAKEDVFSLSKNILTRIIHLRG